MIESRPYNRPNCGGVLWQVAKSKVHRYRKKGRGPPGPLAGLAGLLRNRIGPKRRPLGAEMMLQFLRVVKGGENIYDL